LCVSFALAEKREIHLRDPAVPAGRARHADFSRKSRAGRRHGSCTYIWDMALPSSSTLLRGALAALVATAPLLSGCSAAAGDAAAAGAASALSSNPAFYFHVRGEGTTNTAADTNLTNAYWLAYASFEIYATGGQSEVLASLEQVPGLNPVTFDWFEDPETDCAAFYVRTPEVAIVAYKGTIFADWKQYLILADVGLQPVAGGQANAGFVDGFNHLWPAIRADLVADAIPAGVPLSPGTASAAPSPPSLRPRSSVTAPSPAGASRSSPGRTPSARRGWATRTSPTI
jgi:hypothetical protein